MNTLATTTGSSLGQPRPASMHPLFHDLFVAVPAVDEGPTRPSHRRQVLTRTVRRAIPSRRTR